MQIYKIKGFYEGFPFETENTYEKAQNLEGLFVKRINPFQYRIPFAGKAKTNGRTVQAGSLQVARFSGIDTEEIQGHIYMKFKRNILSILFPQLFFPKYKPTIQLLVQTPQVNDYENMSQYIILEKILAEPAAPEMTGTYQGFWWLVDTEIANIVHYDLQEDPIRIAKTMRHIRRGDTKYIQARVKQKSSTGDDDDDDDDNNQSTIIIPPVKDSVDV